MNSKMKKRDLESPATGGETAQVTLQESTQWAAPRQIVNFRDILDIIINISDAEWMSLTKHMLTKKEFADLYYAILQSAMKQQYQLPLPTMEETDSLESISLYKLTNSPASLYLRSLSPSPTFSVRDVPASGYQGHPMGMTALYLELDSDTSSATASSRASSALVRETLHNNSISSQQGLSDCSSTSPVSESCSMDPVPVDVKRRHLGFRCKAPTISVHWKKSSKVNPACLVPDDHKLCSSSGHLQESSHLEPRVKTSSSSRKKCCKLLSRMCSAISNALPNPFKCMAR